MLLDRRKVKPDALFPTRRAWLPSGTQRYIQAIEKVKRVTARNMDATLFQGRNR